jgi:hypothetical protein
MSDTRSEVSDWPHVAALRMELAERARRVAEIRQAEEKWTAEETVLRVEAAAAEAVDDISTALCEAVAMALDVWVATR